jgi:hypothetical protein
VGPSGNICAGSLISKPTLRVHVVSHYALDNDFVPGADEHLNQNEVCEISGLCVYMTTSDGAQEHVGAVPGGRAIYSSLFAPSSSGNLAIFVATRRASSIVSTFACRAREHRLIRIKASRRQRITLVPPAS